MVEGDSRPILWYYQVKWILQGVESWESHPYLDRGLR